MQRIRAGFTLIELSLVLVIIGLIVGGILMGKDMIDAAKIRSQASQLEQIATAVSTFRLKYNGLAGDLTPAQLNQFGLNVPGTDCINAEECNNNGTLDCWSTGALYRGQTNGECINFFAQLGAAKLIAGDYVPGGNLVVTVGTNMPAATFNPAYGIIPHDSTLMSLLGAGTWLFVGVANHQHWTYNGYPATGTPMLSPQQAYALDSKMDDGVPLTGKLRAIKKTGANIFDADDNGGSDLYYTGFTTPKNCVNTGGLTYNMTHATPKCAIAYQVQ